jgi:hypothetical protein
MAYHLTITAPSEVPCQSRQPPCRQPSDRYLKAEMTKNFERSPFRDDVLELIASAPAKGIPISAVLALPGAGSRDAVDHLLGRMVVAGEVARCGRGRYRLPLWPPGPFPHGAAQPVTPGRGASPKPVAPIPAAPEPQAAPKRRIMSEAVLREPDVAQPITPVHEALVRDIFRRKFGLCDEALLRDEDRDRSGEQPPASMDADTFCATISCMYGRHGLCPPFRIREFALSWLADGITPEHCLAVVDRHLREHAASCRSGSGDRLLPHLDKLIRFEWNGTPRPQRRRPDPRPRNSLDDFTNRSHAKRIGEADWMGNY